MYRVAAHVLLALIVSSEANGPTTLRSPQLERLMPFVGNGFVATHPIVGSEGGVHAAYKGSQVFMSGVYNGVSKPIGEWGINRQQSHRAALPDWVTNVSANDTTIRVDSYSLDMQRAIITKSWTASKLQVDELHLAHRTRRNLLLHIVNATNHGRSKAALTLSQYPGPTCGAEFTEGSCPKPDVQLAEVTCGQHRCMNGSIVQRETPLSPLLVVAMAASTLAESTIWIDAGETKTVLLVRSFSSSLDGGANPLAVATSALEQAVKCDTMQLLSEHVAGWAEIWESGMIEVESDTDLASAINGSLYNILSSLRADWPYGSSPGGLGSAGYHGASETCCCKCQGLLLLQDMSFGTKKLGCGHLSITFIRPMRSILVAILLKPIGVTGRRLAISNGCARRQRIQTTDQ